MGEARLPDLSVRRVLWVSGGVSAGVGTLVLIGWHSGNSDWVQISSDLVPMQYNTALLFVLAGLAVGSLAHPNSQLMFALGGTLVTGAGLTLLQYLLAIDFHIDRLFMEPYLLVGTSHPGRMAPNTAICFILLGALLLLEGGKSFVSRLLPLKSVLGPAVLVLGAVAFFGYLANIESAYGWGKWTGMAVHTSFNFMVLGAAVTLLAWRQYGLSHWLSVPVALAGALTTLLLWQALTISQQERLGEQLHQDAHFLSAEISGALESKLNALERLTRSWEFQANVERQVWEADAERYVENIRGLRNVYRIDSVRQEVWTVPQELPLGRGLGLELISKTANGREPPPTSWVELPGGTKGFAAMLPFEAMGQARGYIVGLFDLQALLQPFLSPSIWSRYQFRILAGKEEVYRWYEGRPSSPVQRLPVRVAGGDWRVEVWPAQALLAKENSRLPLATLLVGLTMSGLAALAVGFAQSASLRAAAAEAASSRLRREIREKKSTEQALSESEALYQDLYDNAPDMFLSVEAGKGTIIRCNETLLRVTGYSREEILGRSVLELYHPCCRPQDWTGTTSFALDQGSTPVEELQLVCKDGRTIDITATVSLVRGASGEVLHSRAVWRDTTEKKMVKRLLQEANENLEESVRRRTDQLQRLNCELSRSNEELAQFAYVASHDLQEPLRKVISYTQLLAQRYQGQMDEKADRFIGYAVDGALRMQKLINDLLSYSRVNTQARTHALVDTNSAFDRAVGHLQGVIEESQARVTRDPLPTVDADEVQMVQLFQNLIGNGIKYHRDSEGPTVHVSARQKDGYYEFTIRDNGIGIDPAYQDRIFVIFQRLHTKTEYPGTGIGLALCKRIVERHGGRIWVESQPAQGATFCFTIGETIEGINHETATHRSPAAMSGTVAG